MLKPLITLILKTTKAFNRNSAQLSGANEIHGSLPNDHMIVTSDRDCSELCCLSSACTFDKQFSSTGYSQLQAILSKFAFVRTNRNQLETIENPHGSSSAT